MSGTAFEDMVLPGFDQPDSTPKARSKKQEAEDQKVIYRRHGASPRAKCQHCAQEHRDGKRPGINEASYERAAPNVSLFLCRLHTASQRHADTLAGLISGTAN